MATAKLWGAIFSWQTLDFVAFMASIIFLMCLAFAGLVAGLVLYEKCREWMR